jgi:uncharacterized protein YdaU (DUF1376 family)
VAGLSKQPFLPLFFGDFLASTAEWSGEEASLYLTLLGYQWTGGTLPAEPAKLARLVRWERKAFERCWPQVSTKFETVDGRLLNRRLEQHRVKSDELAEKNRASGRKGAEARWRKDGERHSPAMADAKKPLWQSIPSHPIPSQELSTNPLGSSCVISSFPVEKIARAEEETAAELARLKAAYPPHPGRTDWITAEHHIRRHVESGAAWDALHEGVRRYAEHVRATGRLVLNPARFFGDADRPWSQAWPIPPTKAQATQDSNIAAARAWLEGTHAGK